jgi:signal transduction histidine kinase
VETISRSIDADAFTAFVALPDEGQQECVIDVDREGASIAGRRLSIDRHTTGEVFRTGRQTNVHGDAFDRWVPRPDPAAGLLTPVFSDGRVSAVITVMRRTNRPFDPDDAVLMRTVAEQVGAALRGAELRAQSEGRARRLEALEQRQRALLNRLVRAQEQERSKVAGDLHDDTVQVLSACVLALDRVRRSIEDGKLDRASASLREVAALVSGAVERTRRMTFELRPAVLWEHGLAAAVSHLLASLERENPEITTALDSNHLPDRLDPTIETIAFRSISELLANVRTHAVATEVHVRLARLGGGLEFEVRDNGHGFELEPALERARSTDHLGLETVTERIDAAGGTIEIETAPGTGTRVVATLPAHAAPGVGTQPS